jgi:hypothetical protein
MTDGYQPHLDRLNDLLMGMSNQEIWDLSLKDLAEGMTELTALMALSIRGTLEPASMRQAGPKIATAMYGFEELAQRDNEPEVTSALAWGTREVLEGFWNSPERLRAGMTAINEQLNAIHGTPE